MLFAPEYANTVLIQSQVVVHILSLLFFSNPKCAAELDGWNLDFDQNLLSYPARVLPTEMIFQADGKVSGWGL